MPEDRLRLGRENLFDRRRKMRWDPYILNHGSGFDDFWCEHLNCSPRDVLLIVGRGFDSRALDAPHRIVEAGGAGLRHVWMLVYDIGQPESEKRAELTEKNVSGLKRLFGEQSILELPVRIGGTGNRSYTPSSAKKVVTRSNELVRYTDVVVDVSAMPRMVALTVVAQLIALLDECVNERKKRINLHVVIAESVIADRNSISGSLSETVTNIAGFSGHLNAQGTLDVPRVWFPVLGEMQAVRLERIRQEVNPDEVCPVIPFPARDPRRGDRIVDEYRQVLFEEYQIEPRDIVYACEYNPFESYREIFRAIDRYRDALRDLKGCKAFVSPLSSKLLSVGALLACYDHRTQAREGGRVFVGMPYLESVSYSDPADDDDPERVLYSMWVTGEWEQ